MCLHYGQTLNTGPELFEKGRNRRRPAASPETRSGKSSKPWPPTSTAFPGPSAVFTATAPSLAPENRASPKPASVCAGGVPTVLRDALDLICVPFLETLCGGKPPKYHQAFQGSRGLFRLVLCIIGSFLKKLIMRLPCRAFVALLTRIREDHGRPRGRKRSFPNCCLP
jgi:hypothetical protein